MSESYQIVPPPGSPASLNPNRIANLLAKDGPRGRQMVLWAFTKLGIGKMVPGPADGPGGLHYNSVVDLLGHRDR